MNIIAPIFFTILTAGVIYSSFLKPPKDEYINTSSTYTNSIRYHSTGSSAFRGGGFSYGK